MSTLLLHDKRANYQACIWRRALLQNPIVPSPDGHGWAVKDDIITIEWLGANPAPDEVLSLLSCLCKRTCRMEDCCCLQARLKCTYLCATKCDNMVDEESFDAPLEQEESIEDMEASDVDDDFDQ